MLHLISVVFRTGFLMLMPQLYASYLKFRSRGISPFCFFPVKQHVCFTCLDNSVGIATAYWQGCQYSTVTDIYTT
jgi:hypothetical protein